MDRNNKQHSHEPPAVQVHPELAGGAASVGGTFNRCSYQKTRMTTATSNVTEIVRLPCASRCVAGIPTACVPQSGLALCGTGYAALCGVGQLLGCTGCGAELHGLQSLLPLLQRQHVDICYLRL